MKRFLHFVCLIGFALACLVQSAVAFDTIPLTGAGGSIAAHRASPYSGPGDIVSGASVWYGLRAYNLAYATGSNNAVNVRRTSDGTTQDIVILIDGGLDYATAVSFANTDATCIGAIATTTLTVASCSAGTLHVGDPIADVNIAANTRITAFGTGSGGIGTYTVNISQTAASATFTATSALFVTKWYDQSGNSRDAAQATAANQPQLLLSGCSSGTLACMLFDSANTQFMTYTLAAVPQPLSLSVVGIRTGNNTSTGDVMRSVNGAEAFFRWGNSANTVDLSAGASSLFPSASDGAWHNFQVVFNDPATFAFVDATETGPSGSLGSMGTNGSAPTIGRNPAGNEYLTANLTEYGIWPSAFSTTQATNICHNQFVYWGTPTSC